MADPDSLPEIDLLEELDHGVEATPSQHLEA